MQTSNTEEMVTISRAACLIFSVSHEKIILQNSEKSQCFQWVSGNFSRSDRSQSCHRPVGLWLLDLQSLHEPAVLLLR